MASRDRPTDEEVAAACKEGNPVTKVTMVLFTIQEGLSAAVAVSSETRILSDACGPDLRGNADMAA